MNWIRIFIIQCFYTIVLFFGLDYVNTNYLRFGINNEVLYRVSHNIYHHSLRPSFEGIGSWGGNTYRACTDGNGFKSDCDSIQTLQSNFDVAFIGDSFTEAIGVPYEDSFVGMFAASKPNLYVANLGVSSYSPTVYRSKIKDFITRGYIFNHLVVFVDISDIQDETWYFTDSKGRVFQSKNGGTNSQTTISYKVKTYIKDNFFLFRYALRISKQLFIDKNQAANENIRASERRSEWTYNTSSDAYSDLGVTGAINKAIREMTLLHELLDANAIKLSVGVYPWPAQLSEMARNKNDDNLQVSIWRDFCVNRCVNFVNMFPEYLRLIRDTSVDDVYQGYFIKGDVHYNVEGNRLINKSLLNLNFNE